MRPHGRIVALVLAAGRSTRFGSTKQLAVVDDRPLVRVSVDTLLASGVDDVTVVLGHDAARVRAALVGLPVRTVVNERYGEGMATSIAAGVASLDADVAAALVALADQPVAAGVVERLIEEWLNAAGGASGAGAIVAPRYAGIRGNPVLFDAAILPELTRLEGDHGARDLLDASPERVTLVDFDFAPPPDVDRREDLERLSSGGERASADSRQADRPRPL